MKELTDWLINIENLAENLYTNASTAFMSDRQFSGFLRRLAEEEKRHGAVMTRAADYLHRNAGIVSDVRLDDFTRDRIEAPFLDCGSRLSSDTLTREHLVHCIVSAEYSEWNDVFVYVMNALKDAGTEFSFTAAQMQAHKAYIEDFIESMPEGAKYLGLIRRLPRLWRPRILVVEDHDGVREFLTAVLSSEGDVETAVNGTAALDLVRAKRFDAIVSDVDMPAMDGMTFYGAAVKDDSDLDRRFLFLTGNPTEEFLAFAGKNRLRWLAKTILIHELERAVKKLLDGQSYGVRRSGERAT
jgi:CheY-like chemotaxis protein